MSTNVNGNARSIPLHAATQAPRVSLVIPTLNEAENLGCLLPTIGDIVDELVIVDGRSTDGTIETALALRPDALIVKERRAGKGYALQAGFHACSGDIIVMMDADGSMAPAEIDTFVSALLAGADVVKGSRFLQGGGSGDLTGVRMLGNAVLTRTVRWTFGGRFSDLCYGYMAFWRDVLPFFDEEVGGFEIETFLNVRSLAAGLRVVEVASYEEHRINGESNLSAIKDGYRVLSTIVRERRRVRRYRASLGLHRPDLHSGAPMPHPVIALRDHRTHSVVTTTTFPAASGAAVAGVAVAAVVSEGDTCPGHGQ
jgi:glycosyltransferase involved in cell wall biosynthesis